MDERRLPLPPDPPLLPEAAARLDDFLDLLLRWNSRINLVADRDAEAIRTRHIADSLQLLPLLPPGDGPMADLGSGAGFPGLILAIATGRPTHLIEADRRKAAFLTEAAGRLGLAQVQVHPLRIEAVRLPPVSVVTARALAPLAELLAHAARLLAPGGVAVFPKGRTAEAELTAALAHWTVQVERFASRTDPTATILRLSDIRRAGTDA
ncbi:16S rRNA (guanine(527)-N(7))-methyltransferase RsmG [Falsiroseomonas oryzae]|uniref:16S rRNA (guanine(527)-N(7))-methyltransferase RsmG n=1 Tax=Falsiroseomonas oryzae TaxID=2766473 RepID=UPI0022EA8A10|nr:16S rRNA (guanine(527)-N(7))-methyltransferase RsmG [Roseomonas sp. MO-31]